MRVYEYYNGKNWNNLPYRVVVSRCLIEEFIPLVNTDITGVVERHKFIIQHTWDIPKDWKKKRIRRTWKQKYWVRCKEI